MDYLAAGAAGFAIGILDYILTLWAERRENFSICGKKGFYRQKLFWFLAGGMAAVSVYFMWRIGSWNDLFWVDFLICGYLMPLCVIDYIYRFLPDLFHLVYGALFVCFKMSCGTGYDLINGGMAVVCVLAFLGAAHLVKRDQFGMGDLKLLCVCGFLAGMPAIAWLFFRGLIVAGVYSAVQLTRHRADLKTEFPFVPFFLIGILI